MRDIGERKRMGVNGGGVEERRRERGMGGALRHWAIGATQVGVILKYHTAFLYSIIDVFTLQNNT